MQIGKKNTIFLINLEINGLNIFAQRLIYEEAPFILPKNEYENIHKIIAKQVLSYDNEKWNTLPKAYHQLDSLRNEYEEKDDKTRLTFLEDLDGLLQEFEKNLIIPISKETVNGHKQNR